MFFQQLPGKRRQVAPRAVLSCIALALALGLETGRSSLAAVVVISNRSDHAIRIDLLNHDDASTSYQVPPRGLIPIVRFSPVTVRVSVGEATTVQDLVLNRIYEVRVSDNDAGRTITIAPVQTGNVRPGVWLVPNDKKLPTSVTIPVAVFVDEEQPARQSLWEPRLRAQIAEASRFLEWFCRVRFQVVSAGSWISDNNRTTAEGVLDDFRAKVMSKEARLFIGFSSQITVPADGRFHALPRLLDTHIVLPDVQATFSAQAQLMVLIHALGHFLGAVDTLQEASVMNPDYLIKATEARQPDYFDPLNILIMNIVAEDMMFRGIRQVDQFSTGTKDYLSALYRFIGQRTRRRDVQIFLDALDRPVPARERFLIQWWDGQQTSAPEILQWGSPDAQPEAAGRPLFDEANPVRWILDTSLQDDVTRAEAWLELWAGDRLPGRVEKANPPGVYEKEQLPAHLEVTPYTRVDWPSGPARATIRVLTSQVKRIVWKQVTDELIAGQAFLRDGRSVPYRLVQWNGNEVRLLTSDGIQTIPLSELAELHLPAVDPWEEILHQRASLVPDGKGTIVQLETNDGLIATTSLERFVIRSHGDKGLPENWYHCIQPVWSLDGLWVPHRSVVWRRFFSAHEVPLYVISPASYREMCSLGGRWGFHVNRNLNGTIMASGSLVFGWGFGVPSGSELVFPLAPLVSGFETKVGLDKLVGDGGCIRAAVAIKDKLEHSIYESPLIVGSARVFQVTSPTTMDNDDQAQLILRIDEAHEDRPPAADPWNVRDVADWGEPILLLDRTALATALRQRGPQFIWAWSGWQPRAEDGPPRIIQDLDDTSPNYPVFRWLHVFDKEYAIQQTLTVPTNGRILAVFVCRPRNTPEYRAEVFANGELLTSSPVPERSGSNLPPPIEADVSQFAGQKTQLRILLRSKQQTGEIKAEWHAIELWKDDSSRR